MTGMAETEVNPQEEMANLQDTKVFAVERHGLPEDFTSFRAVWDAIVATRICAESCDCLGSAIIVAGTGRDSVFQVCILLS